MKRISTEATNPVQPKPVDPVQICAVLENPTCYTVAFATTPSLLIPCEADSYDHESPWCEARVIVPGAVGVPHRCHHGVGQNCTRNFASMWLRLHTPESRHTWITNRITHTPLYTKNPWGSMDTEYYRSTSNEALRCSVCSRCKHSFKKCTCSPLSSKWAPLPSVCQCRTGPVVSKNHTHRVNGTSRPAT